MRKLNWNQSNNFGEIWSPDSKKKLRKNFKKKENFFLWNFYCIVKIRIRHKAAHWNLSYKSRKMILNKYVFFQSRDTAEDNPLKPHVNKLTVRTRKILHWKQNFAEAPFHIVQQTDVQKIFFTYAYIMKAKYFKFYNVG